MVNGTDSSADSSTEGSQLGNNGSSLRSVAVPGTITMEMMQRGARVPEQGSHACCARAAPALKPWSAVVFFRGPWT